jgi:hypothetical protein
MRALAACLLILLSSSAAVLTWLILGFPLQRTGVEIFGNLSLVSSTVTASAVTSTPTPNNTKAHSDVVFPNKNGTNLRVISFVLFHDRPSRFMSYYGGLIHNIRLIYTHLPGWVVRVYYDRSLNAMLDLVRALGAQTFPMTVDEERPQRARLWRFLAVDDDNVEVFLSRDSDSRFTPREAILIREWIDSNKSVHMIRDHENHNKFMLAGMWGARAKSFRQLIGGKLRYRMNEWRQDHAEDSADEDFLEEVIWPLVVDDVLVHDTNQSRFACTWFPNTCVAFPHESLIQNYTWIGKINGPLVYFECTQVNCEEIELQWRESAKFLLGKDCFPV